MTRIVPKEAGTVQLRDLVKMLIPEPIGKEIVKHALSIFPLRDTHIRKEMTIKKPKADGKTGSSAVVSG